MSKELLRMKRLANLITESEYIKENEQYGDKTFSARKLLDLIAQGFKTSPLYQDDVQLSYEQAVNMMSQAIELEGSEGPADGALNDYIDSGQL